MTETEAAGCRVRNVGGTFGTINTSAVNATLETKSGHTYALFTPNPGPYFVEIEIAKVEGKPAA